LSVLEEGLAHDAVALRNEDFSLQILDFVTLLALVDKPVVVALVNDVTVRSIERRGPDASVELEEKGRFLGRHHAGVAHAVGEQNDDLALGCGLPTEFAQIKPGDTIVDLGSGAGNDCFIARSIVGASGRVIGIDMTEAMISKARSNAEKLGFKNVEFRLGDIDNMPIDDSTADVVVSNCVMNLVPNKQKAFAETFRIIKQGGHFSISDIVLQGELPDDLRTEAALYAGCISGAVQKEEYLHIIKGAGFTNITVQKDRKIDIPNEILAKFLSVDLLREYNKSHVGIFSVTVYAEKP